MAQPSKLKLDLHVHTTNSNDAHTSIGIMGELCDKLGIDGVAITDHNKLTPTDSVRQVIAISGIEISSRDGHIIALGIPEPIPRDLSADETIRRIHDFGGVCIIPHPYDLFRSSVRPHRLIEKPDALEVINSSSFFHSLTWNRAKKFSIKNQIPPTGGSDSHIPETVGRAFTIVETPSKDLQSILQSLREGYTSPTGSSIRFRERIKKLLS